jgi:transketolase
MTPSARRYSVRFSITWELFEKAPQDYKEAVLLPDVTARISIEAGVSMGWERYVGSIDAIIAIDRFGASAPGDTIMENFGFTADRVVYKAIEMLAKQKA